tara:strand:+ start:44220 stop:46166 length:1947 start_codon:yes stop_codon:yes gene_type:complete
MKKLLLVFFLSLSGLTYSQLVQIWNNDFDTPSDWDLTIQTGQNDSDANVWVISDEEGGETPPNCGVASNGDPTLHVSCQGAVCIGTGAIYNAGDNGLGFAPSTTNKRAALTVPISTVGETGLELVFDWIGVGQAGADFAELEYSTDGGTSWNVVWTQTPGNVCGGGQGEWAEQTVALPVAAENQADLRFAFHWRNDNDGSGTDPSFAVNNLRLFADDNGGAGPTADFTASSYDFCEGDCIDLTDASTGNGITSWSWTFNGASTASSTDQNPTNICYPTAGTYDIILEVTDADGTDQITQSVNVTTCGGGPTAAFTPSSTNLCEGDCISFTDNSTGNGITSWNWTFNGASTASSTDQNPTNICFPTAGTYDVTLEVTDADGTNQTTQSITVTTCSGNPPTAAFTIDTNLICAGDCISFTDQSTGDPDTWSWTFQGGTPNASSDQNPSNICFDTPGSYQITLTVTNDGGSDQTLTTIDVLDLPEIEGFGDTLIEIGGSAELEAVPANPGFIFWEPGESLDCDTCANVIASPVITTTYFPQVIGANGCIGRDTVIVAVDFEEIVEVPSAFSPNNDGVNDFLHVLGVGIVNMEFRIYNRFGQLVFESTEVEDGWDGTLNGEPLNQGLFVYTLTYDLVNGASGEKSGNITLVK